MEDHFVTITLPRLREMLPFPIEWHPYGPLDGELRIIHHGISHKLLVSQHPEVRPLQLERLTQLNADHPNVLIMADRITSDAKEALRNRKVAYLEANGNIFLDQPGLFLWVDSQPPLPFRREVRNRAFTKTGLKVLFHLLQDASLIERTQRELAELAGVALGNIPQVIQGLRDKGYLTSKKEGGLAWQNREELLQRWMIAYENTLRPSLMRGRYRLQGDWTEAPLTTGMSVWGGDAAADLLFNHAEPQHFVLYTLEAPGELLTKYRLLPSEEGELTALELFWNPPAQAKTAPPLLVYTELTLTGGKYNEEPAQALYEQYILPNL